MDTVRRETQWVTGCSHAYGGSGDPSPVTAYGTLQGIKACLVEAYGDADLKGRRFAVQGVGKVGYALCGYLVEAGAEVVIADIDVDNLARAVSAYGVETAPLEKIHTLDVDVFAPCALGGVLNDDTIPELNCRIVAGSANNQLASPKHGDMLKDRGILYAPDFVINAGGLINVEDELRGYEQDRAMKRVEGIYKQLHNIFQYSRQRGISTAQGAEEYARERIVRISRIRLLRTAEYGVVS
jgi:leucine dehydrogenase